MKTAMESNAIVSSLFPSNIRDRLVKQQRENNDPADTFKNRQDAFMSRGGESQIETSDRDESKPPIADLFPAATILFADIAGFTSWSSTRDPVQVFTLLESIYGSFDRIARRRGVFKVETIVSCDQGWMVCCFDLVAD